MGSLPRKKRKEGYGKTNRDPRGTKDWVKQFSKHLIRGGKKMKRRLWDYGFLAVLCVALLAVNVSAEAASKKIVWKYNAALSGDFYHNLLFYLLPN